MQGNLFAYGLDNAVEETHALRRRFQEDAVAHLLLVAHQLSHAEGIDEPGGQFVGIVQLDGIAVGMRIVGDGDAEEVEDGLLIVLEGVAVHGLAVTEVLVAGIFLVQLGEGESLPVDAQLVDNPDAGAQFAALCLSFHEAKVQKNR